MKVLIVTAVGKTVTTEYLDMISGTYDLPNFGERLSVCNADIGQSSLVLGNHHYNFHWVSKFFTEWFWDRFTNVEECLLAIKPTHVHYLYRENELELFASRFLLNRYKDHPIVWREYKQDIKTWKSYVDRTNELVSNLENNHKHIDVTKIEFAETTKQINNCYSKKNKTVNIRNGHYKDKGEFISICSEVAEWYQQQGI